MNLEPCVGVADFRVFCRSSRSSADLSRVFPVVPLRFITGLCRASGAHNRLENRYGEAEPLVAKQTQAAKPIPTNLPKKNKKLSVVSQRGLGSNQMIMGIQIVVTAESVSQRGSAWLRAARASSHGTSFQGNCHY